MFNRKPGMSGIAVNGRSAIDGPWWYVRDGNMDLVLHKTIYAQAGDKNKQELNIFSET